MLRKNHKEEVLNDQSVGMVVFVVSFCLLIYFLRASWRAFVSPEFKREMERFRERRRLRRSARRDLRDL